MACHPDLEAAYVAPNVGAGGLGVGGSAAGMTAGGPGLVPGDTRGVNRGRQGRAGGHQGLGLDGFVGVGGAGLVFHGVKLFPSFHEVCPDFR